MSSYLASAIDPKTGQAVTVTMLDNHFGPHRYGVRFPDGEILPEDKVRFVASDPQRNGGET